LRRPHEFATVFERHFAAVHAYVQRRVGVDLADEVAAETFARAFDRRRRYDLSRPDARPWLLGIATNILRRHWRGERRRLAAYARAAPRPSGDHLAPGAAAEALAVLRSVPKRDRDALLLFAWADLTYEEIAVALDVPVGTVRSRIARIRRALRKELGDIDPRLPLTPSVSKESTHA
jgi:RNA polymerase sigma factor (sigma-70 family)